MTSWKSYDWYKVERCPQFVQDADCCDINDDGVLPIKLDVPQMKLHHLFWCVDNCEGLFHRCRQEKIDPIADNSDIAWVPVVNVMAFENKNDAIMFRLRWGMIDDGSEII